MKKNKVKLMIFKGATHILCLTVLVVSMLYIWGLLLTPDYMMFKMNITKMESNAPAMATLDEYAVEKGYKKTNAVFYSDKINIEGIDKNYIEVNGDSLKSYWEYYKYTPMDYEIKEVYYKDSNILTPGKLEQLQKCEYDDKYESLEEIQAAIIFSTLIMSLTLSFPLFLFVDNAADKFKLKYLT